MKLFLVRHGQTEDNVNRVVQGHSGRGLNALGREQAKRIALRLKKEKIDAAYSSELQRAAETVQEILRYHPGVKVVFTCALRERKFGSLEGLPREKVVEVRDKSGFSFAQFRPEGGETLLEVQERVTRFYEGLRKKHFGQNVLLVSHGGTLASLMLFLQNREYTREHFFECLHANCALTVIEVDDNKKHEIKLFNCVQHLE